MPTVYGYVRVSSLMQVEGDSLETQSRQIQSYAVSRGWEVSIDNIFVEGGVSGATEFADRPEGARLLKGLAAGDVVVFTKLDRAFRNVRNAFNTLHDLKEQGVSVHFLDLGGEVTGNGVGAIVFAVMSAFASFERERIATRIREVKQMQKSMGRFVGGRRPFGFTVVEGKYEPLTEEQRLLDQMRQMRDSGSSYRTISNWLASVGVSLTPMGVSGVLSRAEVLAAA